MWQRRRNSNASIEWGFMRVSRHATPFTDSPYLLGEALHRPPRIRSGSIDISVVMPCLNEQDSVASTVREALEGIKATGLSGEVIVVDNGSFDDSVARAKAEGARVIREVRRGYGNACRRGLQEAQGRIVVLGDSDGTYDFRDIPRFVAAMRADVGIVMGNRLHEGMEDGAMPWLHRYVGNPGLTAVLNMTYSTRVSDSHCGLRAIRRTALERLDLRAPGMEFASEFLIAAASDNVEIAEIPITYRRRLGGVPKLRTFRDGWRHLRLLLTRRYATPQPSYVESRPSLSRV